MAKKKPYMVFETKEEFDKIWDEQVKKAEIRGRAEGFKAGCTWLMSYIMELFQDLFKPEMFTNVEHEIRERQIEKWRKDKNVKRLKDEIDEGWKPEWRVRMEEDGRE